MTTVRVEVDPDTGDYILPLDDKLLSELGWDIGDTLVWEEAENNAFSLRKLDDSNISIIVKAKPELTEKIKEILSITQEECAEVIQAIAKIDRFGLHGTHSSFTGDNCSRLTSEIGDLIAMIDLLVDHGVIDNDAINAAKEAKIKKLKKWSGIFD